MNSIDLLFHTSRFNLSVVGNHFINPCCFGEDLAAWLREKLAARGIHADPPGQEDWGWYLGLESGPDRYMLAMSGNADDATENTEDASEVADRNDGEWRIIVEKSRSLSQRLRGAGKIESHDPVVTTIENILHAEPHFRNIKRDSSS